jgi:hypothetical protein
MESKSSGIDIKVKGTMANNNKINGNWRKPNVEKEMPFVMLESNSQYESLKKQITEQKYKSISGQYDFEYNATGVSFASVGIKYSGNNKFQFEIAIGHESGCTGEVSGIAIIDNNGVGRYSGEDCKLLTFNFSSSKLIIDESDCQLHGARCSFAGEYVKSK